MNKKISMFLVVGMFMLVLGGAFATGQVDNLKEKILTKLNLGFSPGDKASLEARGYQDGNLTTSVLTCNGEWCSYNFENDGQRKKTSSIKQTYVSCTLNASNDENCETLTKTDRVLETERDNAITNFLTSEASNNNVVTRNVGEEKDVRL